MLTEKCRLAPTHRPKMTSPEAEIIIKMSSVLSVSNGNSKSKEFNLSNIEVLVDREEQNWFKQAHVGKFLGLKHIDTSMGHLDKSLGLCMSLKNLKKTRVKHLRSTSWKILYYVGLMQELKRSKENINKPSQIMTIKYKPLSLQMKKINRKFWGSIKRLMIS